MSYEEFSGLLGGFLKSKELPGISDDVRNVVIELKNRNLDLYIVSTCPSDVLLDEIEKSNLSYVFPTSNIFGDSKDKSKLIQGLDITPEKSAIVGDTYVDIEAGKRCGLKTFAFLGGYQSEEQLKKYNPDLIIGDIRHLLYYI